MQNTNPVGSIDPNLALQPNQSVGFSIQDLSQENTPLLAGQVSALDLNRLSTAELLKRGRFGQCLTGELQGIHGVSIGPQGVVVPEMSSCKFITLVMVMLTLAILSGASGYMGAEEEGGPWVGAGAWVATTGLNANGGIQFLLTAASQIACSLGLPVAMVVGFLLAALPPAVLAGMGAIETFFGGPAALKEMTTEKYGVGGTFATINFFVSGALNTQSLLNLGPGILEYGKRILGYTQVWSNKILDGVARLLLFVIAYPAAIATLLATMARGHSTYNFVLSFLHHTVGVDEDHAHMGAKGIFVASALPGFAMFLYGTLKLTLFIEQIIYFILVRFRQRVTKVMWSDVLITSVAFGISAFFAAFVMLNYIGLSKKTYEDDWWLGRLIPDILNVLLGIERENSQETFERMAFMAAGANLLQRVGNFTSYFKTLNRYRRYRAATPQEQKTERALADEIYTRYQAERPAAVKNMRDFVDWLKNANSNADPTESMV